MTTSERVAADIRREFLTSAELAERWRVSEGTLRNQRNQGRGITFVRIGRLVRYPLYAVEAAERLNGKRVIS